MKLSKAAKTYRVKGDDDTAPSFGCPRPMAAIVPPKTGILGDEHDNLVASLTELRAKLGMAGALPDYVASHLQSMGGNLSLGDFERVCGVVCASAPAPELVEELFLFFDRDANGTVDQAELAIGVTLLCGGDPKQKARAMFEVIDRNQDGFVDKTEMETYMIAVFKLMQTLNADTFAVLHTNPTLLVRQSRV